MAKMFPSSATSQEEAVAGLQDFLELRKRDTHALNAVILEASESDADYKDAVNDWKEIHILDA